MFYSPLKKVKVGMQITRSLINELIEATENAACPDAENPLENRFAKKEVMQSLDLVFPNDTKQVNTNTNFFLKISMIFNHFTIRKPRAF